MATRGNGPPFGAVAGTYYNPTGVIWTPAALNPLVWYIQQLVYLELDGPSVNVWQNKLDPGGVNNLENFDDNFLDYQATGWQAAPDVAAVNQAPGEQLTVANAVAAALNGTDKPFSLLMTFQLAALGQRRALVSWDDGGISSFSGTQVGIQSNGATCIGKREDGAGSITFTNGTASAVATGKRRVVFSFNGTNGWSWVDTTPDIVNGSCDVGIVTVTRCRLGDALDGGTADAFSGKWAEIVLCDYALPAPTAAAIVANYQTYSLATFLS